MKLRLAGNRRQFSRLARAARLAGATAVGIEGGPVRVRREREPDDGGLVPVVLELAAYAGFDLRFHDTDARKNPAGLPDLLLIREPGRHTGRLILAECKKDVGWSWSHRGGGAQRERFLGLLKLSCFPLPVPLALLTALADAEPAPRRRGRVLDIRPFLDLPLNVAHSTRTVRPETYLWQPAHLEVIKHILWHGNADGSPL